MKHGILTARLGHQLAQTLDTHGMEVLYDHGWPEHSDTDQIGRITAWFRPDYHLGSLLAFVDLAVVARESGKALALVEIEETTDKPKVLLGDVVATLLGDGIKFQGKQDLLIGPWTTLLVFACDATGAHQARIAFLNRHINQLQHQLTTPNATIGKICLEAYRDETELAGKLHQWLTAALSVSSQP